MQARIVTDFENGAVQFVQMQQVAAHVVRAHYHGAQLEHSKAPAAQSDALLRIERRAAVDCYDRKGGDCDDRGCEPDRKAAQENVDQALERDPCRRYFSNGNAGAVPCKMRLARYLHGTCSNAAATVLPT